MWRLEGHDVEVEGLAAFEGQAAFVGIELALLRKPSLNVLGFSQDSPDVIDGRFDQHLSLDL